MKGVMILYMETPKSFKKLLINLAEQRKKGSAIGAKAKVRSLVEVKRPRQGYLVVVEDRAPML